MNNRDVYWLAGVFAGAAAVDLVVNGGAASLFLVLKLLDLVEYLMFWR